MMTENMAAFMPPFIESHRWVSSDNYKITAFDTSLILAAFSMAQLIFSPVNSVIKNRIGAKNAIVLGFVILTVTTFGLGAIAAFEDPHWFKYIAVALRFFQGQGSIM